MKQKDKDQLEDLLRQKYALIKEFMWRVEEQKRMNAEERNRNNGNGSERRKSKNVNVNNAKEEVEEEEEEDVESSIAIEELASESAAYLDAEDDMSLEELEDEGEDYYNEDDDDDDDKVSEIYGTASENEIGIERNENCTNFSQSKNKSDPNYDATNGVDRTPTATITKLKRGVIYPHAAITTTINGITFPNTPIPTTNEGTNCCAAAAASPSITFDASAAAAGCHFSQIPCYCRNRVCAAFDIGNDTETPGEKKINRHANCFKTRPTAAEEEEEEERQRWRKREKGELERGGAGESGRGVHHLDSYLPKWWDERKREIFGVVNNKQKDGKQSYRFHDNCGGETIKRELQWGRSYPLGQLPAWWDKKKRESGRRGGGRGGADAAGAGDALHRHDRCASPPIGQRDTHLRPPGVLPWWWDIRNR